MSLLQMSFLGTVIILLIVVLRAVLINRLPKKTFLILWWIALIRLLVPFSIKSVTSIYSLLQSIYSDINPVRTAQTTTFLPIHGNMPEIANGLSEAMVQRTESISILSVIWLAGLLLCFGFFAVSYIKCYREFRFSLPVENDILNLGNCNSEDKTLVRWDQSLFELNYWLEENEQLKNNPTIDNFISWVHKIENAKKEYLANLDHFE
jgi:beta-lactamase regulating signal transducer with metallopeptidase domain